eukprot:GCRY01005683.1.p1 GENE.GCRY01005683.1~~GCRY01005683.1.p1  ORF type:complete len:112 (+),score=8.33 GCRY01005683.1:711-1046(+)
MVISNSLYFYLLRLLLLNMTTLFELCSLFFFFFLLSTSSAIAALFSCFLFLCVFFFAFSYFDRFSLWFSVCGSVVMVPWQILISVLCEDYSKVGRVHNNTLPLLFLIFTLQ